MSTCKSSTTKCENVPQEVCQQVPYRVSHTGPEHSLTFTPLTKVAVPGSRTVQPPPKWEVKCETATEMIPQCKVDTFLGLIDSFNPMLLYTLTH